MTNLAPPPPPEYQPVPQMSPSDEKLWSTVIHLAGIFFGFIPALIGYLTMKDRGPFIREHTRSALSFQISYAIYAFGITIVAVILAVATLGFGLPFIFPALIAFSIAIIVFCIIAAVKANAGEYYRYPLSIELIK